MSGGEFAAIEARWSTDGGMGSLRSADDYTDAGCRILAEHAFRDMATLAAAVRERDNTIARVRDIVESVHATDDLDPDGYQVAGLIRAALDPQETP